MQRYPQPSLILYSDLRHKLSKDAREIDKGEANMQGRNKIIHCGKQSENTKNSIKKFLVSVNNFNKAGYKSNIYQESSQEKLDIIIIISFKNHLEINLSEKM